MKEKHQRHQQQSFIEDLYDQYKVPLLCIIRKYVKPSDAIEDNFQEVIIRIIKNADLLSRLPKPKMEAYIYLVARGVSIDHLRTSNRKEEISIESDIVLDLLNKSNGPAALQSDPLKKADLSIMMEKLPSEDKILLVGKYYLGLSTNELVDLVGGSAVAVRSKVFRARKRLQEEWTRAGLRLEDFLDE